MLRALSGTVAAGVVVLTAVVVGAAFVGSARGFPGPGTASITWHVVACVAVLFGQHVADHRRRIASVAGSIVVIVAAGVLLWTQWWG